MTDQYEYECALSGIVTPGELSYDGDELHDLPVGWIEVRMSRRVLNPQYVLIQQIKSAMAESLIGQYPEEIREAQGIAIRVQIDAQFYGMEQETPPYLTEAETVYLAPPEVSEDVAEAVNQVREMLGLEPLEAEEVEEEQEEPPAKKVPAKKAPAKKAKAKTAQPST